MPMREYVDTPALPSHKTCDTPGMPSTKHGVTHATPMAEHHRRSVVILANTCIQYRIGNTYHIHPDQSSDLAQTLAC